MSEIVCQVGNQAGQVEFIWSSRGGYFKPYVVAGTQLTELRQAADQTRTALESLVFALNRGRGRDTLGAVLRAGRGRLPAVQLPPAQRGRDGPQGPPLAGGPEEAVGSDRPGGRRRGAVGRRRGIPLRAVEPGLRRAARQVQGRVPEGARGRALAAVLVGPLQPDQRPAGRAPEAAAALERPAGRRGGGPDRPRGPQRRAEGGGWTSSWPRRA